MFLVDVRLGKSAIHGWGVFARQRIPAGTRTWEFVPGVDQLLDPAAVDSAREDLRNLLIHYTYLHPFLKRRVLCGDIAKFMNHSDAPNIQSTHEANGGFDLALRDIEVGEELTVDYQDFKDPLLLARVPAGGRPPPAR
ncbi:MAG: SET domain-containing protein [Deltaproteobacteria bacterium]